MPTPSLSPFFFQAEDGIRDRDVTGVQTCALPISPVAQRLQEVIAVGNVRIDNGTRWATGGRAVFEQATRMLVLTENPVLHDGANEVSGDRVTLYLDENRSVVEGGRRRVKATVFPNKDGGLAGANAAPPKDAALSPQAAAGGGEDATP